LDAGIAESGSVGEDSEEAQEQPMPQQQLDDIAVAWLQASGVLAARTGLVSPMRTVNRMDHVAFTSES
jgi:hypothetical protein